MEVFSGENGKNKVSSKLCLVIVEGVSCLKCNFSATDSLLLKDHSKEQHQTDKSSQSADDDSSKISKQAEVQFVLNENRRYECVVCKKDYKKKARFQIHFKEVHVQDKKFACSMCNSVCSSSDSLYIHRMSFHADKIFKCPFCNQAFGLKSKMNAHIRDKHKHQLLQQDSDKPHFTNNLNKLNFTQEENILNYTFVDVSCNTIKIEIPDINNNDTESELNKSIQNSDPLITDFPRRKCPQVSEQQFQLKKGNGEKYRRYPCLLCEQTLATKRGLKRHQLTIHGGLKFHCEQCNQKYTTMWSLKCHITAVHTAKISSSSKSTSD